LRVVHIYKDYPPVLGGIEKHLRDLALGLPSYGIEVAVVACSQERHTRLIQDGPTKVVLLAKHFQISSAPVSLAMPFVLRRLEPDLVHVHLPYPPGELAALVSGRPAVCTYHSPVVRQRVLGTLTAPITRALLRKTRKIVVSNPRIAVKLGDQGLDSKTVVIPFGVDLQRFRPPDRHEDHDHTHTRLLFLGRFRYYKGLPVLLQALSRVPSVTLTLAGDGPDRQRLELLVEALSIQERVAFVGNVPEDELPSLYRSHDIFVLPSDRPSETFGIAMLEAMACGLPCISTELSTGTSWLNLNGTTGLVVPPGDAAALADAMQQLAADGELRRRMGTAARRRAEEFPAEAMLLATAELYRQVLL
jgi:rhamnosyl/mannosyltransferase